MLLFVIVCKLARTDCKSGQYSASCSVVVSLPLYYTGILNRNAMSNYRMHTDTSYPEVLFKALILLVNIMYYITIRTYR